MCSQTSSQSGTLSGTSSGSSSSSAPHSSSSSSGTSSSGSGYPPSSSHSSGSPEDPPSDNSTNKDRGSPGSGGSDSKQPPTADDSLGDGVEEKDKSGARPTEENMDATDTSKLHTSLPQSSLEQVSQSQGTQDSFLTRRNISSSVSSQEVGESGYSGGSSSASALASASLGKSPVGSLSVPLVGVTDSQETVENSVSCIEDSAPLTRDAISHPNRNVSKVVGAREYSSDAKSNPSTHQTTSMVTPQPSCHPEDSSERLSMAKATSDPLKPHKGSTIKSDVSATGSSPGRPILIQSQEQVGEEQQISKEISRELLPIIEPPHSPELLNALTDAIAEDKMDAPDSPEIAFQAPDLRRGSPVPTTSEEDGLNTAESPEIAIQAPRNYNAKSFIGSQVALTGDDLQISECSQAMETDLMSTQTSFVLQFTDSQCTLTPISPSKTGKQQQSEAEKEERSSESEGTLRSSKAEKEQKSSKSDDMSCEEVEEYEKEFPNLIELEQQTVNVPVDEPGASEHGDKDGARKLTDTVSKPTSCLNDPSVGSKGSEPPLGIPVKSKPVPLYESLMCDDSNSEASPGGVSTAQATSKEMAAARHRLSESLLHSVDTSQQSTSSGEYHSVHVHLHVQFQVRALT